MILEAVLLLAVTYFLIVILHRKPSFLPPGEWGFPVIGYVPMIGKRPSEAFKSLLAKYGKIFSVKVGSRIYVVLSDYSTIKTCFAKLDFSYRADLFTTSLFSDYKKYGIIFSNGDVWSENRKFAVRALSHFGMGKSTLEDTVKIEVAFLIEDLRTKVDKPTKIDHNLNVAILNVLWVLVADKRFDQNDDEIKKYSKIIDEHFECIGGDAAILDIFPWLIPYTPRFLLNFMNVDKVQRNQDTLHAFCEKIILEHKESLDKNKVRSYIDMYLVKLEEQRNRQPTTLTPEDVSELKASMLDLFAAGTETSASSIRWYILYMAKYPEIQRKIQQEIDLNVPRNRFPSLEDKENLPYFQASIFESMRFSSLGPTLVPHAVVDDCQIDGYIIPKGTIVIAFAEACHRSTDYWERPNEFYPQHFIDDFGKFYIPEEGFLQFSLGRRKCPGEPLAKMELFLFLGAILQNFTIMEPEGKELSLDPDPAVNFTNAPDRFEVLLKVR